MIHRYKPIRSKTGKFQVWDKVTKQYLSCSFNTRWEAEHTAKGLNRVSVEVWKWNFKSKVRIM